MLNTHIFLFYFENIFCCHFFKFISMTRYATGYHAALLRVYRHICFKIAWTRIHHLFIYLCTHAMTVFSISVHILSSVLPWTVWCLEEWKFLNRSDQTIGTRHTSIMYTQKWVRLGSHGCSEQLAIRVHLHISI